MWSQSKYRAKKVTYDGITFDSMQEGDFYLYLKKMEGYKYLEVLGCHTKIYLTKAKILFKPDFKIKNLKNKGAVEYWEYKGRELALWRLKRRLWKHYMNADLQVWKQRSGNFYLHEIVKGQAED